MRTIRPWKSVASAAALVAVGALASCANDATPNDPTPHDNQPVTVPKVSSLGLRFDVVGDTETSCGNAAGVHVAIAKGDETQECTALWAEAQVSDPYTDDTADAGQHHVADCFFVLSPGEWNITDVSAIGDDGEALSCCESDVPSKALVSEGSTSELGVPITCDVVGSGALDIYGWLNLPPYITNLTISPSKFVPPCYPVDLDVSATDVEGDALTYSWMVTDAPDGAGYQLNGDGAHAEFAADAAGDYTLVVTVTDGPHGMVASLEFPIHVTGAPAQQCDLGPPLAALQVQMVDGADPVVAGDDVDMSSIIFNEEDSGEALTDLEADFTFGAPFIIPPMSGFFTAVSTEILYDPEPAINPSTGQVVGTPTPSAYLLTPGVDYDITASSTGMQAIVFHVDLAVGDAIIVRQTLDTGVNTPSNDYDSAAVWRATGASSGLPYNALSGESTTVEAPLPF